MSHARKQPTVNPKRWVSTVILFLLMAGQPALANQLELPSGMGGVPDIGAIPCHVFSEMLVIGSKGTRHSLLTWAAGYFNARTGKNIDEVLNEEPGNQGRQDFFSLTDHFVDYCKANPEAQTRDAVVSLGQNVLGIT